MLKRTLVAAAALSLITLAGCSSDSGDDKDKDAAGSDPTAQTSESPSSDAPSDPTAEETGGAAGECTYAPDGQTPAREVEPPAATPKKTGSVQATIATTVGEIPITLDADAAPCTVNSFLSLVEQGYYDDTNCHRLANSPGFKLLQCGDPTGTGSGGPGYSVEDEYDGTETYPAGTLAMANTGQPNTNGSQFFLCVEDTNLPAAYTVFGTMDASGIKVLEKVVAKGDDGSFGAAGGGKPNMPVDITKVVVG